MAWEDLYCEISELFADAARIEFGTRIVYSPGASIPTDREDDADRWISADEAVREAMRPEFDRRLEAFRARCAAALQRSPRKRYVRPREAQRERMKSYRRSSEKARAADNARSKAWRQANREQAAAYLRAWRQKRAAEERRDAPPKDKMRGNSRMGGQSE